MHDRGWRQLTRGAIGLAGATAGFTGGITTQDPHALIGGAASLALAMHEFLGVLGQGDKSKNALAYAVVAQQRSPKTIASARSRRSLAWKDSHSARSRIDRPSARGKCVMGQEGTPASHQSRFHAKA
jgi:hypothetical protein